MAEWSSFQSACALGELHDEQNRLAFEAPADQIDNAMTFRCATCLRTAHTLPSQIAATEKINKSS